MQAKLDIHVGGRLEAAAPIHAVPTQDRLALVVLLVLAIAIHGLLFARTTVNARDGLSFTRLALQLEKPSRIKSDSLPQPTIVDVLKFAEQPPGYPLATLIVSKIVRVANPITAEPGNFYDAQLGERMLFSGQLANCIASVLLVVPLFLLGRLLGGRFVGFVGAALFQVLPVVAHVTSDTLSEGCYMLGLCTAIWLGCRGLRRQGIGNFLAAGGVAGVTYLVRPEGVLVILSLSAVAAWQGISRKWTMNQALGCLAALFVGFALTAAPYMAIIGGFTNKPSGKAAINSSVGLPRGGPLGKFDNSNMKANPVNDGVVQSPALFARWIDMSTTSTMGRILFSVSAVTQETMKTTFYAPLVLAAFGAFALRKRFRCDPAITFVGTFLTFNIGLLLVFAAKIGYVSERHTVPLALVICPLAAAGIVPLIHILARYTFSFLNARRDRWIVALALCAAATVLAVRPLHETRTGFRYAGKYLAGVFQDGDVIVDPFSWAEFYAGPAVTRLIPETDTAKVLYTVLDGPMDKSQHVRLPKMDLARNIAKSGAPVYHWPEDQPIENAKVIVYKTTR
ncbi:MAG: glycosyltransferase family 39 protein [Gemmataceae bacterium]